ncbi:class I SAM-dependent methyltransferase [Georhizobium profundi]|uniref:Class I SAM-dependent methyltransferase n=1 Tax=Georhizobium profundi TaxID=2341112 RepID=A0A3Q8XR37_9HYPH|nr:methyltransferase domain-containing protein [Georhizobium profundi]AZN73365.1 class I SAM-dependent methyltransferase [Georhizobium profundi]
MAFGVDPTRREFFSLRQARYDALAHDIAIMARTTASTGQKLDLLDVGPWDGVLARHLQPHSISDLVTHSIADIEFHEGIYGMESYRDRYHGDLMQGYPEIASNTYDIVVCEQVLEHLPNVEVPIRTLARVLKPGGKLFLGVPIFPHGVHWVRHYGQPFWDKVFPPNKVRGHVQSFSKRSIIRLVERLTDLELKSARGFRIVSGGILRPLEERQWWWRLNRTVGTMVPSLCVEVQVIFKKPI